MGLKSIAGAICDLCHENQPCIYCCSDSAFLCTDCDLHVHSANFLVARHIRLPLCSFCKTYHDHSSLSSCNDIDDHNNDDALSSSSSSTECIYSTETKNTNKTTTASSSSVVSLSFDRKTRDLLMNWWAKLGVRICTSNMNMLIQVARRAFQVWWLHSTSANCPYRVGLAASLWLGLLRFTKDSNNKKITRMCTLGLLKRLEDISGVPAKSIVVAQSKLAATLKHRPREINDSVEESWDEC